MNKFLPNYKKVIYFFTVLFSAFIWGQVTIFSENMHNGSVGTNGDAISVHESNNRFNEDALTFSGTGDMRDTNPSLGYSGFSGTWNVMLNASGETFVIDGINASSGTSLSLTFGVGKAANATNGSSLIVEYSTTGSSGSYTAITWGVLPTGTGTSYTTTYYLKNSTSSIPSNVTTIRFRTTNADEYRIDDVKLTGSLDGVISTNEYGNHTNGQNQQTSSGIVTYTKWDDTNLYVGVSGANLAQGFVMYLDKNPIVPVNGGANSDGTLIGNSYDGINFAELPFRADVVFYVKNTYREYRTSNGSNGWSAPNTAFGAYGENAGTSVREFSIPWSAIGGKPSSFNFFSFLVNASSSVYGQTPTENAGGSIGTSARYSRYYTVSSTASGSSTPPFSRNSYTFNSSSDITSFGPINCYDFTMNTSGRFLSRTGSTSGDWNIAGNLVVGNGTVYLGSGGVSYGNTNITGNLNILGGTFDMDQTTGKVFVDGNVSISSGATLKLSGTSGGDIKVKGDWTDAGTFTPNNRAVYFNGTGTQTVTNTSVFLDGHYVEIFNFLTVEGSGTLKLGNDTNIRVISADGLTLSSTNAITVDLNGNTLNCNGGGDLSLANGNRKMISSSAAQGYFRIADNNLTVVNTGTLTMDSNVSVILNKGFNPGAVPLVGPATTIYGSLLVHADGFLTGNTVNYATGSWLKYETGGVYNRNYEWNGTTAPVGVPYNVQLMGNTTLNYVNLANTGNQYIVNTLNIDTGSKFFMDYGSVSCGGSLNIGGNLVSAGDMTLGYANGDDLKIGGNITFSTGYTFDAKGRAIYFNKSTGSQTITASSKPVFHYLVFDSANNLVRLITGTSLDITAPNGGAAIAFNSATNVFDINDGNTLTIGTAGVANTITGNGTFTTGINANPANMIIRGLGSIGTLNFSGNQNLASFTIDRQATVVGCVLGTPLKIANTLNLTNGIIDLGANLLTLGNSTSGAGTLTGGSSNSYIVADKTIGGKFKRFTPALGSYFFPIGDASSSADGMQYSPATVNMTVATTALALTSTLEMNVEDSKELNNEAPTNYITRYWNLNGTNINGVTYNFTGNYLPVDIVGTEGASFSGRYANSKWTEGAALASNTVSITGLSTTTGDINTTPDSNHYSGGSPLTKAKITIKQAGTPYISGSTFDFGAVVSGTNLNKTFTIFNDGLEDLNLGAATITGARYSIFTNYTSPVAKLSSNTFVIRFSPDSVNTFTGSISIPYSSASGVSGTYVINFTGTGVASNNTDIISNNNEATTISSIVNNATINTNTDGVKVWQFTIRDGGGADDQDNLPSILTSLTITQGVGNQVTNWSDAIQSVAIFSGTTKIANGIVSSNQIQFTGLNISVPDKNNSNIDLRLSLKNPLGSTVTDGDDFVFSILNANTTFSNTGSGKYSFLVATTTNSLNAIDVAATELRYIQDASTTAVNEQMADVIIYATDVNGNVDKDYISPITITSDGTLFAAVNGTFNAGKITFSNIVHSATATSRKLTAASGTLPNKNSALFDIVIATTFELGDVAVLAVNVNVSSGADQIALVTFKDILPGTKIYLTDNGYERVSANKWGNTEGLISITRKNSTLPKGTIIVLESISTSGNILQPSHFDVYTCGVIDNNWVKSAISGGSIGGFNLNIDDDLWVMQGGAWLNGTDNTHDATYTGTVLYGWTESGWDSAPGAGSGDSKWSTLYPNTRCFTTIAPTGDGFVKFEDPDAVNFSSTTRDKLDWIALINKTSNWNTYADSSAYNAGGYNYKTNSGCPQITIAADYHTIGKWNGANNINWFDCSNWDNLKVPDQTVDVTFNSSVTYNPKIDYTATDSDLYGDIAKAKNITINKPLTIEGNINNKLEVHGNLVVNSGGVLDMDDGSTATQDGQIYLYGNWTNNAGAANFHEGNGTVHLLGTITQVINGNNHTTPETFGNLVLGNNFNTKDSNDIITTGNLTINSGKIININDIDNFIEIGGNFTNNGTLTVDSDANLVQNSNTGTYTGNTITVKRTASMKRLDYTYWGSPVSSQNLRSFSMGTLPTRFYTYNESTDGFVRIDPYANSFTPGKGYAIRSADTYDPVIKSTFNGVFSGMPNNGNVSYNLDYTNATRGHNLVSNPYASNIDLEELYSDNSSDIAETFYFWTNINPNPAMQYENYPQPGSYNNYAIYNASGGIPPASAAICVQNCVADSPIPTNIVKPGQGFIVKSIGSGKVLDFKNSHRTRLTDGKFFNARIKKTADRYWLQLITPIKLVNTILVAYKEGSTLGYEENFDAKLLMETSDSFYSLQDNNKLSIQGRGYPLNLDDKISLGASFYKDGKYNISIANKEGIFASGQPIYLHDKLKDIYVNLQQESYSFDATQGVTADRFEIVYKPASVLATGENNKFGVRIYQSGENYIIDADEIFEKVNILDASGRLVRSVKSGKKQLIIEKNNLSTGIYVFSVIFANKVINKKIISN